MIKCNECGLCKEACPVFRVVKKESVSPRGFAILDKKQNYDKVLYYCTLCNNCKVACPYGVDLKLEELREKVLEQNGETDAVKEMITNLRDFGNPYGMSTGMKRE